MFKQSLFWILLLLFPLGLYYQMGTSSAEDEIQESVVSIQRQLALAGQQLERIEKDLRNGTYTPNQKALAGSDVFIYQRSKPYYWSTNDYEIDSRRIFLQSKKVFVEENDFGKFILLKGGALQYTVVVAVPLERTYAIHNRFLQNSLNSQFFGELKGKVHFEEQPEAVALSVNSELPLFLELEEHPIAEKNTVPYLMWMALWLLAVALYLIYAKVSLPMRIGLLVLVRIVLFAAVPEFSEHLLFSPAVFASSVIQPNLFQYIANLLLIVYVAIQLLKHKAFSAYFIDLSFGVLCVMVVMLQDLIRHSTLQITPFRILNFDSTTMVLLTVLLSVCVSFGITLLRASHQQALVKRHFIVPLALALLVLFYQPVLALIYGVAALGLTLMYRVHRSGNILIPGFLLLSCAILITFFSLNKEKERVFNRKISLANMLVSGDDPYMEYLINEVSDRIADDRIITSKLKSPFGGSERFVRDKVTKVYLQKYFSGYEGDVQIVSFERVIRNGDALEIDGVPYNVIKKGGDDLYQFVDMGLAQNDYVKLVCFDDPTLIQHLVITLRGKNTPDYSVIPQLLLEGEAGASDIDYDLLNYAVLKGDQLMLKQGAYFSEMPEDQLKSLMLSEQESVAGYDHFRITKDNESLIVSSPTQGPLQWLNTFSLVAILLAISFLFYFGLRLLVGHTPMMLSEKLQLTFGVVVIITFILLLVVAVGALSQSYSTQIEEDHLQKAERVGKTLTPELSKRLVDKQEIEQNLNLLASHNESDIHLYNNEGRLLSTTLPELFEKHLKSTMIPYSVLNSRTRSLVVERIGSFELFSAYYPIYTGERMLLGYINIPFFDAKEALRERINNVSYLTLNISFGVLCVLLIISFMVSKRITSPILTLSKKLDQLNLDQGEPLYWDRNDEIGKLVQSYNLMLVNLQKSREALQKQEKEAAWKEMAKQVAHEVKNPLTPMKLSLQFLLRKLSASEQVEKSEIERTTTTMIEQIDALSSIVESFSQFASMPEYKIERTDIIPILNDVVRLHRHTAVITLTGEQTESFVQCDGKALHAIFSNIIINGVQAVSNGKPKLTVQLQQIEDMVQISIQDNGDGIPDDVADKVFIPNFSTKYTGSGIGLALAKKGVQEFGGTIWFDTIPGEGTTFYIKLPLSR